MFPPKTKVLVIDDMTSMRKIIISNLKEIGLTNASEAIDGADAWSTLQKAAKEGSPFELVLSDWSMPNLTGLELLKKVRTDENYKTVPFIMVTAEAEQKAVIEAVQAKVSNYITKPFTVNDLRTKIEYTYKKHTT